jgi:sulfur-carrier protein
LSVAISILYFARVREAIGQDAEMLELPADVHTATQLMQHLAGRDARYARAFAEPAKLRCAIDQVMAPLDASILGAKEVAFFPPVTGG